MNKSGKSILTKGFAILWLLLVAVLLAILSYSWRGFDSIETDLLKLLPQDNKPAFVQQANQVFLREVSQRIVFMISGSTMEQSLEVADFYTEDLKKSDLFHKLEVKQSENIQDDFKALYFPYKEQIYSSNLFIVNKAKSFAETLKERATQILSMPVTPDLGFFIKNDPFFLFLDFLSQLSPLPGKLQFKDGYLVAEYQNRTFVFVRASLKQSVFNNAYQKEVSSFIHNLNTEYARKYSGFKVLQGGALKFAEIGSEKAEKDILLISWGSAISTVLILLIVFRSAMPLIISISTVSLSIGISTAVALLFFPKIHLVTLGFGASLIGVCADYSFHFFCHRLGSHPLRAAEIISRIGSAISLGVFTGILGYIGLFILPFPGLNQMALFAIVGMLSSWLSVIVWYPFLPDSWLQKGVFLKSYDTFFLRVPQALFERFRNLIYLAIQFRLHYVFALVVIYGLSVLNAKDDVRSLQSNTPEMLLEEKEIRELNGNIDQSRYFLVADKDIDSLLEKERKLVEELKNAKKSQVLVSYQAISNFVPSVKAQEEKFSFFKNEIINNKEVIVKDFTDIGYSEKAIREYIESVENRGFESLNPELVLSSSILEPLKFLWLGKQGDKWISMILLQDVRLPSALRALESEKESIYFVDLVHDSSFVLQTYRVYAAAFILIFYLGVYLTLIFRYGLKFGSMAILPGMLALISNLALHGIFGWDINLFSILANAIVLGLAVDYSIFLLEDDSDRAQTMLAILLSAVSTIASFGLLAVSATPLLSSFGTAMFVGILLSLLFCPLSVRTHTREN